MALGKGLNALIGASSPAAQAKKKQAQTKTIEPEKNNHEQKAHEAPEKNGTNNGLMNVLVSKITPNPHQPRNHFDEEQLLELVDSIKKHGILQPLVVSELADGNFELIAGERRFRAAQKAELVSVPCLVKPADEKAKLEIGLVENIQRSNLNPIEEAFAYQRLIDEFGLTQEQVGKQVGKSRSYIANTIRLLDLPQDVQKGLSEGKISMSKARALLGLPTIRQQLKAYYDILEGAVMSTRDTEALVRSTKTQSHRNPSIVALEQKLRDKLGTKVSITNIKGKGNIRIDYFSDEELRSIADELL